MKKRVLLSALSLTLLAGLGLTGCAPINPDASPKALPSAAPTVKKLDAQGENPDLQEFYNQTVNWKPCGALFCAKVAAPMDYQNPKSGQRVEISMVMVPSPNRNAKNVLINPGGPGGSGVATVRDSASYFFTNRLMREYNIIGFDPRGVGESTPAVNCFENTAQQDEKNSVWHDLDTPAGREAALSDFSALAQRCQKLSGDILKFVDTDSASRDMDIMRQALGMEKLNYIGYSYGTYLGAIYADNFPKKVGRFVLDGIMDPSLNVNEVSRGQAVGFEKSTREFLSKCVNGLFKCPFTGDVDKQFDQLMNFLMSLADSPLPTSDPDRLLTLPLAFTATIGPQYTVATWSMLASALNDAVQEGDGSTMLLLADMYNSREGGKYTDNSSSAFTAINALDYVPVGTEADWEKENALVLKEAPHFGRLMNWASLGMDLWPVPGKPENKRVTNPKLDAPIMLIGTTGDPATPYPWAQHLAETWKDTRLVTFQGWGHTAYNTSAPVCITNLVDTYMIDGTIPEDEASRTCSQ